MTTDERTDFKELRAEMRQGFVDLAKAVSAVDDRVRSLELTRAGQIAVKEAKGDSVSVSKWGLGLLFGLAIGVAGLALRVMGF